MPIAGENTKAAGTLLYCCGNASGIIMLENHLAGSTKGKQNKSKVHHFSSWVYPQKMEICPSKDLNKSLQEQQNLETIQMFTNNKMDKIYS